MEKMKIQEIQGNRDSDLLDALTEVWNESVRTSHNFLSEPDIEQLKPYVDMALRGVEHLVVVYCDSWLKGLWVFRVTRLRCFSCHRSASVRDGAVSWLTGR